MKTKKHGRYCCCDECCAAEIAVTSKTKNGASKRGNRSSLAALRKDVDDRLSEARRDKTAIGPKCVKYTSGFYDGEIAALEWLVKRDDERKGATHTDGTELLAPEKKL